MNVRLSGDDITEALIEYVTSRGMQVKGKFEVKVNLQNYGWIKGNLDAIIVDIPIETPPPKQGPYR